MPEVFGKVPDMDTQRQGVSLVPLLRMEGERDMKLDAIVGTKIGGGTFRPKIIMPLADLPLGERLYSAATIRKWLEEEPSEAMLESVFLVKAHDPEQQSVADIMTRIVHLDICKKVIAAKLEELK